MARPNEVKKVAAAISEPAESAEAAAKAAIAALDEARQDRTDYLVVRQAGGLAQAFGPYATYAQVVKAIEGGKIPALDGSRFFCVPLYHPTQAERALAESQVGGMSEEAKKIWAIARAGGQAAKTHSRRNRRRVA